MIQGLEEQVQTLHSIQEKFFLDNQIHKWLPQTPQVEGWQYRNRRVETKEPDLLMTKGKEP